MTMQINNESVIGNKVNIEDSVDTLTSILQDIISYQEDGEVNTLANQALKQLAILSIELNLTVR